MDDNRNAPATKGDIEALKGDIEALKKDVENSIDGVRSEILDFKVEVNTRFQEFEHRLEQLFSDMEARVVATMYRLGEAGQQRLTAAER